MTKKKVEPLVIASTPGVVVEVDIKKSKVRASGKSQHSQIPVIGMAKATDMARKMSESGFLDSADSKDWIDKIDEYMMLETMGTPPDVIKEVLKVNYNIFRKLRAEAIDRHLSTLREDGVIGTVAQAFSRLEYAAQKTLGYLAGLKPSDAAILEAVQSLTNIESRKIDLLVKTGAVKVERKVVIRSEVEANQHDFNVLSGQAAMRLLAVLEIEAQDQENIH